MDAEESNFEASDCDSAWEGLDNVESVECSKTLPGSGPGAIYSITFTAFPALPSQNNVFSHDGNPDLSSFTCDTSSVTASVGTPTCLFEDDVNTSIIGA